MSENDQGYSGAGEAGEPSDPMHISEAAANPRRQPQNLQGVLRYSIEAGSAAQNAPPSSVQPMNEERRNFLEATLRAMQGDNPAARMSRCVEVVSSGGETEQSVAERIDALDNIIDLVDNIDNAMDFHKIGGFSILPKCLTSSHKSVRCKGATLIAELSQNNPYIQTRILETDLLASLLSLVADKEPSVQVSALYAVSCVVRGNAPALQHFAALNGWTVLLKAMTSSDEKLQLKSAFLLSALCSLDPEIVPELCRLSYVEHLCGLLTVARDPLLEHLLRALVTMVTCSTEAAAICLQAQLQLDTSLAAIIAAAEVDSDERLFAEQLKVAVFGVRAEDDGER